MVQQCFDLIERPSQYDLYEDAHIGRAKSCSVVHEELEGFLLVILEGAGHRRLIPLSLVDISSLFQESRYQWGELALNGLPYAAASRFGVIYCCALIEDKSNN